MLFSQLKPNRRFMNLTEKSLFQRFVNNLKDFDKTETIEFLSDESSSDYRCYKYTYRTKANILVDLIVEFDLTHNKVSYGPIGSNVLETHKLYL